MKTIGFARTALCRISEYLLVTTLVAVPGVHSMAQEPNPNRIDAQEKAMQSLSFLVGNWLGPVTIMRGTGEPLHLTQTEAVEYKLDGLVMLVEGKSTDSNGKVLFSALATIAYDDASHQYRFRGYNDGHYIDTELLVIPNQGFSWGFTAGPAHIVNTMKLSGRGEWNEVTEATVGSNPPHPSVEMRLHRKP